MDLLSCIKLFRRAAETKSFSSVTQEFGLTQPMVSKRIAWLEDELGVSLFRRSTRGIELTPEGQRLYRTGGPALDELELVLSSIKHEKFHLKGQLRISASLAFARLLVGPYLGEFHAKYPDLRLDFVLSDGYMDLVGNNIDLAFRIGDLPDSSLKAIKIAVSHRRIYASKSYLKKNGSPQTLEELEMHSKLFYNRLSDVPAWPLTDRHGKKITYSFQPYLQSDGSELIRECMFAGVGVALLPTWMVEHTPQEKLAQSILEKFAPAPSPIYLVTAERRELSLKQRAVIDFFRTKYESIDSISLRNASGNG